MSTFLPSTPGTLYFDGDYSFEVIPLTADMYVNKDVIDSFRATSWVIFRHKDVVLFQSMVLSDKNMAELLSKWKDRHFNKIETTIRSAFVHGSYCTMSYQEYSYIYVIGNTKMTVSLMFDYKRIFHELAQFFHTDLRTGLWIAVCQVYTDRVIIEKIVDKMEEKFEHVDVSVSNGTMRVTEASSSVLKDHEIKMPVVPVLPFSPLIEEQATIEDVVEGLGYPLFDSMVDRMEEIPSQAYVVDWRGRLIIQYSTKDECVNVLKTLMNGTKVTISLKKPVNNCQFTFVSVAYIVNDIEQDQYTFESEEDALIFYYDRYKDDAAYYQTYNRSIRKYFNDRPLVLAYSDGAVGRAIWISGYDQLTVSTSGSFYNSVVCADCFSVDSVLADIKGVKTVGARHNTTETCSKLIMHKVMRFVEHNSLDKKNFLVLWNYVRDVIELIIKSRSGTMYCFGYVQGLYVSKRQDLIRNFLLPQGTKSTGRHHESMQSIRLLSSRAEIVDYNEWLFYNDTSYEINHKWLVIIPRHGKMLTERDKIYARKKCFQQECEKYENWKKLLKLGVGWLRDHIPDSWSMTDNTVQLYWKDMTVRLNAQDKSFTFMKGDLNIWEKHENYDQHGIAYVMAYYHITHNYVMSNVAVEVATIIAQMSEDGL